jgi:ABC-type proline/glycine betaine transport system ATPase subunit
MEVVAETSGGTFFDAVITGVIREMASSIYLLLLHSPFRLLEAIARVFVLLIHNMMRLY